MNDHRESAAGDHSSVHHIDVNICLDLVCGLLPPAETERILAHVADCPACEELLRSRVLLRERFLATRRLRAYPGGELGLERTAETAGETVREREGPVDLLAGFAGRQLEMLRRGFGRPRLQLAAGLALAAGICLILLLPRTAEPPVTDLLRPLPVSFDVTRLRAPGPGGDRETLAAGLESYLRLDLEGAIASLESAQVSEELEIVRRAYLGSAYALSGRNEEAVRTLHALKIDVMPEEWRHETLWTLWVALQATGRTSSADSLLELLAEEPGEIGGRARGIKGD